MKKLKKFVFYFLYLMNDKTAEYKYKCKSRVPENEIMNLVRMYHPIITAFFNDKEEVEKFNRWREEQKNKQADPEETASH